MSFTYSNTAPNEDTLNQLYVDCETYLVNETLPEHVLNDLSRKDWVKNQLSIRSFHTQIMKDNKVICWFAGEVNEGIVNYIVALVSPDANGSRSYWYDIDFWNTAKMSHRSAGLNGWMAVTQKETSLHSTLIARFDNKPEITEITEVPFMLDLSDDKVMIKVIWKN